MVQAVSVNRGVPSDSGITSNLMNSSTVMLPRGVIVLFVARSSASPGWGATAWL
jgi:hypothetical protein